MTEQPQSNSISAAFPAPPPFYQTFTPQNLDRLLQLRESTAQPPSSTGAIPDILSLPPELRNLLPPPPPADGKYRSFGIEHDISPQASTPTSVPTQISLQTLTHRLLLTFLSLTHVLATNPSVYGAKWDEMHALFLEIHQVINGYRPHQARETLILMMEKQLQEITSETQKVRESVERAKGVVERLESARVQDEPNGNVRSENGIGIIDGRRKGEMAERRIWEVLEREVGKC